VKIVKNILFIKKPATIVPSLSVLSSTTQVGYASVTKVIGKKQLFD